MSEQPRGISGMALADTPRSKWPDDNVEITHRSDVTSYLIMDDTPAAAPNVFDTRTCHERHTVQMDELWVALTDARLRIANLERIIAEWSAGK